MKFNKKYEARVKGELDGYYIELVYNFTDPEYIVIFVLTADQMQTLTEDGYYYLTEKRDFDKRCNISTKFSEIFAEHIKKLCDNIIANPENPDLSFK